MGPGHSQGRKEHGARVPGCRAPGDRPEPACHRTYLQGTFSEENSWVRVWVWVCECVCVRACARTRAHARQQMHHTDLRPHQSHVRVCLPIAWTEGCTTGRSYFYQPDRWKNSISMKNMLTIIHNEIKIKQHWNAGVVLHTFTPYVKREFLLLLCQFLHLQVNTLSNCIAERILCWIVKKIQGIPYFDLPGGSDGKESPAVLETRAWALGWKHPLEDGMAAHSSILARRIPWTEEPRGLQSMGSKKVR